MKKCKHKWVNMEDGTADRFCVRCRKFAMQAVTTLNPQQALDLGSKIAEGFASGLESPTHVEINIKPPDINEIAKQIDRKMKRNRMIRGF